MMRQDKKQSLEVSRPFNFLAMSPCFCHDSADMLVTMADRYRLHVPLSFSSGANVSAISVQIC